MAWRPSDIFIEGILDNTVPNKITGWMKFAGMQENVTFELEGNFHRDIRGAKVKLTGDCQLVDFEKAKNYMQGFSIFQKGKAGDMTAGLPTGKDEQGNLTYEYQNHGYYEWYSETNGRCVLELDTDQVELLTSPIPACESDPIDRKLQHENMSKFMLEAALALQAQSLSEDNQKSTEHARKVLANNRIRKMKLLTKDIRKKLPNFKQQDDMGKEAICYVKFFTPDAQWSWYATSGEPVLDQSGNESGYQFFGLVDGFEKELGYFDLGELETAKGPLGLPIERDLYFEPKTLKQLFPELFEGD